MANSQSLATETQNVGGALTSMRIDELIANLAIGIARGQLELDRVCMQIAQFMSRAEIELGKVPGTDEPARMSLIELGFTPNFYQFVDTILEVRVSVSCSYEETAQEDRSDLQYTSDEQQAQSSYSTTHSDNSSNSSYGYGGYNYNQSWWGGSYSSYGGSGYGSSSSSGTSSTQAVSSSSTRKAISLQTVDAKFSSTYNYSLEASSTIKTKIVPVPPPPVFEEVLRTKLAEARAVQKRWLLRSQGIATIKTIALAAQQALDLIAKAGGQFMAAFREALATALTNVRSSAAGLTDELWANIGTVAERKAIDESLDTANEQLPLLADEPESAKPALVTALTSILSITNAIAARPINA